MRLWPESPRPPRQPTLPKIDWVGTIALAWALGFGVAYAQMVLSARFPGFWPAVCKLIQDQR